MSHTSCVANRLQQTSVDASGLLLTRPNSFIPAVDIVKEKQFTIYMDVPGMTKDDVRLSRQNVTTIVKGTRMPPYADLQVLGLQRMSVGSCRDLCFLGSLGFVAADPKAITS